MLGFNTSYNDALLITLFETLRMFIVLQTHKILFSYRTSVWVVKMSISTSVNTIAKITDAMYCR